jgi:uncharacterized membrane protein
MLGTIVLIMVIILLYYVISNQKAQKEERTQVQSQNVSKNFTENFANNTYSFKLKRINDVSFEKIKELTIDFYKEFDFNDIVSDKENSYMVSNEDGKSYFQIENNNQDFIKLTVFNALRPDFIDSMYEKDTKEIELTEININKTSQLIDLANMLDKGLITKEEFEKMKQDLVE